jgi:hypothetical protein
MNLRSLFRADYAARFEYNSDSDKTIIYIIIRILNTLILNLFPRLFSQLDKKPIYKHYYYSALGLAVGAAVLLSLG